MNTHVTLMTLEEILTRWKLLHGWEPLGGIATATTPGLDDMLAAEIDGWYNTMLVTLEPELLPHGEFAAAAVVSQSGAGYASVRLPPQCLRPVSVKLASWSAPAAVREQSAELTLRQHNPFTAATGRSPVAMRRPDGTLALYPGICGDDDRIESLTGVTAPEKDVYRLTPAMLAAIADNDFITNLKKINRL
ncbi:MAG: hypothetical protein K2G09_05950 [Paramuribaculum sp.]|nr:hypothetical protein [Paramuribaculum sp.]